MRNIFYVYLMIFNLIILYNVIYKILLLQSIRDITNENVVPLKIS